MGRLIMGVVIAILFVIIISCSAQASTDDTNNVDGNDIIYTTNRTITRGSYLDSSDLNIIFTRFFMRDKLTHKVNLLFEVKEYVVDFNVVDKNIYFITFSGIYKYDFLGNGEQLVEGIITAFTMDDNSIYYSIENKKNGSSRIEKSDLAGKNTSILAEGIFAEKLTIVNGDLIYSNVVRVGKISDTDQITYITCFVVRDLFAEFGHYFIIDDKIIITRYLELEEYKEYGEYPTLVVDFDGNVVDIWERCIIRYIKRVNGEIYADFDMMDGQSDRVLSYDTFRISDDFKETHLVSLSNLENIMLGDNYYVEEDRIYYMERNTWFSGDILKDGTITNIIDELDEEYPDSIEVVIWRKNPPDSFFQYNTELVTFDEPLTVENGRVLVPMRTIFEALGASVEWDNDIQTVNAKSGNTEINLKIGSNVLLKNGEEIMLDVPAKIKNNQVFVPIRAVGEGLGFDVVWRDDLHAVFIVEELLL